MKEEIKRKISETKKRKYASGEIIVWNKGKNRPPFSEEWRKIEPLKNNEEVIHG